jgi:ATP/maltotriose-dependent transcriptional regulator MalT
VGSLIQRERLLRTLALRHELTLCALVAPAGFGRTVLLDQASSVLGPDARDIRYDCSPEDARPGELALRLSTTLTEALAGEGGEHRFEEVPSGSVERLLAVLAACDRQQPTALCLDRFERSGPTGTELLRHLVADAPSGVHIVVSARHLGHVGLASLVVAGKGVSSAGVISPSTSRNSRISASPTNPPHGSATSPRCGPLSPFSRHRAAPS